MYRFVGKDKHGNAVEPLPGLPLEAADKDFAEALREYEAWNGEGSAAAVKATGLYLHEKDETPAKAEG